MNTGQLKNKRSSELYVVSSDEKRVKQDAVSTETLEALKDGEHSAFEEVFLLYYEKVKYFINSLLKSPELSEELSQEIFVNLWEQRVKIDPYKNFNAYLYVITRNTVYNYVKSKKVRDRYAYTAIELSASANGEELVIAKEMELLVDIAVSRMPKQRRKIFEMSRNEGMSNEKIAEQLNITKNAVEKQLRLALGDVRDMIALVTILFLSFRQ